MRKSSKTTKKDNTINILNGTKVNDLYQVITTENLVLEGIDEFLSMHKNDHISTILACQAARNSDQFFLQYLTSHGIDLSMQDSYGFNACYYAKISNA